MKYQKQTVQVKNVQSMLCKWCEMIISKMTVKKRIVLIHKIKWEEENLQYSVMNTQLNSVHFIN